jgi:hypothetical protein
VPFMSRFPAAGPSAGRWLALAGLGGAVLTGIGDVLQLGRPCSGADFDQAAGLIPPNIDVEERWAVLVEWRSPPAAPHPGRDAHRPRRHRSVGVRDTSGHSSDPSGSPSQHGISFRRCPTLSGAIAHFSCRKMILAYKQASATRIEPTVGGQPSPPTSLLAVGAVGSLSALAIFSIDQAAAGLLGRSAAPILSTLVTPFPFVAATLLTFGFLPAPIGGYARPASISIGLMTYWAIAAASAKRRTKSAHLTS